MVNKYRYKIVFSYDGSLFFGYAKQIDKRTILQFMQVEELIKEFMLMLKLLILF